VANAYAVIVLAKLLNININFCESELNGIVPKKKKILIYFFIFKKKIDMMALLGYVY